MPEKAWLQQALENADSTPQDGRLQISLFGAAAEFEKRCNTLSQGNLSWQQRLIQKKEQRILQFASETGPHILIDLTAPEKDSKGMLEWYW